MSHSDSVHRDSAYQTVHPGDAPHAYGERLTLHSQPYALSLLARLGSPQTRQPEVGLLCARAFEYLFTRIVSLELPSVIERHPTRMSRTHPDQAYEGVVLDRAQKVVVVDVARAGMVPAQIFYERLNELLEPDNVRQDHLFVGRAVDGQNRVTGASVTAAKVGGPLDGAILIVPDPMGATGGSLLEALAHYERIGAGRPLKVICAHLIVTPEYVQRILKAGSAEGHPPIHIHALRLDRGLSSSAALDSLPGSLPAEESGLNDHQYILPGAGGLGEILNNAWV